MALALPHYIYKYLYLGPQFTKTKHTASTSGWQQNRVFFYGYADGFGMEPEK